ncbi:MAG TPA: phosphotransferase [Mucilaginibacter sp.]|nr:phosphotransferase [Mucilaginibacter sp.]
MNNVQELFSSLFKSADWQMEKPINGRRKEKYIVSGGGLKYFLKFDVDAEILKRLARIGVAPDVLQSGTHKGRTFIVQQFIEGSAPQKSWFASNSERVFTLLKTYHNDPVLLQILLQRFPQRDRNLFESELQVLDRSIGSIKSPYFEDVNFRDSYLKFSGLGYELNAGQMAVIHNEPNNSNFLLSDDRLFMVDWDEITLGDPLMDTGPLLWWYWPFDDWPVCLDLMNIEFDDTAIAKIFWFAALVSLKAALFFIGSGFENDHGFIADFIEAAQMRLNPRF